MSFKFWRLAQPWCQQFLYQTTYLRTNFKQYYSNKRLIGDVSQRSLLFKSTQSILGILTLIYIVLTNISYAYFYTQLVHSLSNILSPTYSAILL